MEHHEPAVHRETLKERDIDMVVLQMVVNGQVVGVAPVNLGMRVELQVLEVPNPPQPAPPAEPAKPKEEAAAS